MDFPMFHRAWGIYDFSRNPAICAELAYLITLHMKMRSYRDVFQCTPLAGWLICVGNVRGRGSDCTTGDDCAPVAIVAPTSSSSAACRNGVCGGAKRCVEPSVVLAQQRKASVSFVASEKRSPELFFGQGRRIDLLAVGLGAWGARAGIADQVAGSAATVRRVVEDVV
ncbi:hypothetical protein MRX96_036225 [Rhipicephalus microplus]